MAEDVARPTAPPTDPAVAGVPGARAPRDDCFWEAARATHASGVSAACTAELFDLDEATLRHEAMNGGWLRDDDSATPSTELASDPPAGSQTLPPEASRAARTAGDAPSTAPGLRASTLPPQGDVRATVIVKLLAALEAALAHADDAVLRDSPADADAALRRSERLARTANILSRAKDLEREPGREPAQHDGDPDGEALIARIEQVLEGTRQARRYEIALLKERGLDPREGWAWDEEQGDWIWDPGSAMARAARRPRSAEPAPHADP
jgi:hypothetical protein